MTLIWKSDLLFFPHITNLSSIRQPIWWLMKERWSVQRQWLCETHEKNENFSLVCCLFERFWPHVILSTDLRILSPIQSMAQHFSCLNLLLFQYTHLPRPFPPFPTFAPSPKPRSPLARPSCFSHMASVITVRMYGGTWSTAVSSYPLAHLGHPVKGSWFFLYNVVQIGWLLFIFLPGLPETGLSKLLIRAVEIA